MTLKTRVTSRFKSLLKNVAPRKDLPSYLVYYDGGPSSAAALREACEMAGPGTRVTAIFLDVVPLEQEIVDNTPAHPMLAQAVLAAAVVNAGLYGVEVKTLCVPCHVKGPALVALAAEKSNATLFVGIDEFESEPPLDPFASYVLSLAPCKVVLVGRETFESRMQSA